MAKRTGSPKNKNKTVGKLPSKQQILDFLSTASAQAGKREIARAFKPHLTLGRFKDSDGAPADIEQVLSSVSLQPVAFSADRLVLVRSVLSQHGPTYTTIAEWPLTGTAENAESVENVEADTPAPDDHG